MNVNDWMLAVMHDLVDFSNKNGLRDSALALILASETIKQETAVACSGEKCSGQMKRKTSH